MAVASRLDDATLASPSMSINQIALCWALMAVHGVRRLYECITLTKKSSQSKMWLGHYVYGLMYYVAMGIAIWIDGSGASEQTTVDHFARRTDVNFRRTIFSYIGYTGQVIARHKAVCTLSQDDPLSPSLFHRLRYSTRLPPLSGVLEKV